MALFLEIVGDYNEKKSCNYIFDLHDLFTYYDNATRMLCAA